MKKNKRILTRIIGILVLLVAIFLISKPAINNAIADIKGYEEIQLESYQVSTFKEDENLSAIIEVDFKQEVDIKSANKNIFISKGLEGDKLSNKARITIDPDDSTNIIVETILEEDEKGDLYLVLKKGLIAKTRETRSLRESEGIELDIKSSEEIESLGLGMYETKSLHNERPYEWYITQSDTGEHSDVNCGPTSVTMALKWLDGESDKSPQDARELYRPEGGWWFTYNLIDYLKENEIKRDFIEFNTMDGLIEELDNGNIAILCLDASKISQNIINSEQAVGLYYSPYSGHFIVVKGYKIVDDQVFFQVYDPYLGEIKYENGDSKGKDRYYKGQEIIAAANGWYEWAIIIDKDQDQGE